MATEAAQQVLDTSVDAVGLSIVSATMTVEAPRNGSMYNPVVLAAGVPIHFHALQNGQYVALFRSHWIAATVGTGGPQSYTEHLDAGSCWVRVAPPTGATVALGTIPTRIPGDTLVINGAASRQDFLFTIGNLDGVAIIQHHRISEEGLLLLQAEEVMLPVGVPAVTFDRGCFIDDESLVIIGADPDNNLFMARRRWGRIGQPDPTPRYTWEYRSVKGWLADIATLESIGIASAGPVSVAKFKDRWLLSVVRHEGTDFFARVYAARQTDPFGHWKLMASPIHLGDTGTYLGGALYFQPLNVNPAQLKPSGAVTQLPYVLSTRVISAAEQAIDTAWGLWPVTSAV